MPTNPPTVAARDLGLYLRSLREAQGLTMAQAAHATSRTGEAIGQIERGRYRPSLDLLGRMATAYRMNSAAQAKAALLHEAAARSARITPATVHHQRGLAAAADKRSSSGNADRHYHESPHAALYCGPKAPEGPSPRRRALLLQGTATLTLWEVPPGGTLAGKALLPGLYAQHSAHAELAPTSEAALADLATHYHHTGTDEDGCRCYQRERPAPRIVRYQQEGRTS